MWGVIVLGSSQSLNLKVSLSGLCADHTISKVALKEPVALWSLWWNERRELVGYREKKVEWGQHRRPHLLLLESECKGAKMPQTNRADGPTELGTLHLPLSRSLPCPAPAPAVSLLPLPRPYLGKPRLWFVLRKKWLRRAHRVPTLTICFLTRMKTWCCGREDIQKPRGRGWAGGGCIFQCPFGWLPPAPSSRRVQGGTQNSEEGRDGELDKGSLAEGSHPKGGGKKNGFFLKDFMVQR